MTNNEGQIVTPNYLVHEEKYQQARAKGWPGWGGPERMARENIWLDRLFSCPSVPAQGKVLELGCGEGHYARLLAKQGYTVTGVDVSPTAVAWAIEKTAQSGVSVTYHVADLTQPNLLPGESFDLIVDGNCLHCIIGADRAQFLGNVFRLLQAGGLFFVSSLCSKTAVAQTLQFQDRPYRYLPTPTQLQTELETAGFQIQQFVLHENQKHNHCTAHLLKLQS
ncbi:MAG: class I SAM-dependent methyltransferase [Anaerolineales bacterium]|nr:class I SAM-dependent methyltransferase [Anaerolineales bacterium]